MNKMIFSEFLIQVDDCIKIKHAVQEAKELAKYGETRIALENLLENIIEERVSLNANQIQLVKDSFEGSLTEYNKKLINSIERLQM